MTASIQAVSLPFAHLNLRKNPFGEVTADECAALAQVEIEQYVASLSDPSYVVQFLGEKGYGKTTHLLAIRARFLQAGYVHIPEEQRVTVPAGFPLLIDEAQRLTWWQKRRVFRNHVPLVLGTHQDFAAALRRAGRRVETVQVEQKTTRERLLKILHARINAARRHQGPLPRIREETAARLLEQFGPDVRRIQHELYLKFQNLSAIEHV